jgi:hypothetical protein
MSESVKNPNVLDKKLWIQIREEARKKFLVYPSAYTGFWISNQYLKRGGKYLKKSSGNKSLLTRWKKEIWVNICNKKNPKIKVKNKNDIVSKTQIFKVCGRTKNVTLDKKKYPLCRPSIRINKKTPKTIYEITEKERLKMCRKKRNLEQGVNKKPTRVYFSKKELVKL